MSQNSIQKEDYFGFLIIFLAIPDIYKVLITKYILKQLLLSQIDHLYCKYCGSNRITNVQVTNRLSKTKMFQPSVDLTKVKFSLGSLSKKNESDYTFESTLCQTCINFHVVDQPNTSIPLEIQSSDNQIAVVIPYTLQVQLKTFEYEEDEIIKLIHSERKKLDKIHKRWSKKGHTPCKRGNMGYKISLKLKRCIPIMCYVILDRIQNRTVFRLCYGGGKIECP